MIPQRFAEANVVMKRPECMAAAECSDVVAYRGQGRVITCWRPTAEELVKLNLGEPVWLSLVGHTMQPALVTCEYPFVAAPGPACGEE